MDDAVLDYDYLVAPMLDIEVVRAAVFHNRHGWHLTAREHRPAGTLMRNLTWPHEPTDEQLRMAIGTPWREMDPAGEEVHGRIVGPLFLYKNVGPPPWRWPRVSLVRWGIRFGWRMTAYAVTLNLPRQGGDDHASD